MSNILIDFLDAERKEHAQAKLFFEAIEDKKVKAYFSESVINTTAYILRKKIKPDLFKELMLELLLLIKVLPCTTEIVQDAYTNAKNDLEDAVLYQIAYDHKLDYCITSNDKDFRKIANELLPIISTEKLLKLI